MSGGIIFQWLDRIGLGYAVPSFQTHGVNTPQELMQIDVNMYSTLGVSTVDDRKRLFELVQRVRDASKKTETRRRPEPEPPASSAFDPPAPPARGGAPSRMSIASALGPSDGGSRASGKAWSGGMGGGLRGIAGAISEEDDEASADADAGGDFSAAGGGGGGGRAFPAAEPSGKVVSVGYDRDGFEIRRPADPGGPRPPTAAAAVGGSQRPPASGPASSAALPRIAVMPSAARNLAKMRAEAEARAAQEEAADGPMGGAPRGSLSRARQGGGGGVAGAAPPAQPASSAVSLSAGALGRAPRTGFEDVPGPMRRASPQKATVLPPALPTFVASVAAAAALPGGGAYANSVSTGSGKCDDEEDEERNDEGGAGAGAEPSRWALGSGVFDTSGPRIKVVVRTLPSPPHTAPLPT